MTKRQIIDEIVAINKSAQPAFLADFEDGKLDEYLQHLQWARTPRMLSGWQGHGGDLRVERDAPTAVERLAEPVEPDAPDEAIDEPEDTILLDGEDQADDDPLASRWRGEPVETAEKFDDYLDEQFDTDEKRDEPPDVETDQPSEEPQAATVAATPKNTDTPFAEPEEESESWLY